MAIRLATLDDFDVLQDIYATARAYMAQTGNATQWGTNKPYPEETKESIEKGVLYVGCDEQNVVRFTFVCISEPDPTYATIEGSWPNEGPYVTIHRVASDGVQHGIFKQVVRFAKERAEALGINNLRIDTHDNNLTMQHCITKEGFSYCGTIHLEDGSPRRAYQLVLA